MSPAYAAGFAAGLQTALPLNLPPALTACRCGCNFRSSVVTFVEVSSVRRIGRCWMMMLIIPVKFCPFVIFMKWTTPPLADPSRRRRPGRRRRLHGLMQLPWPSGRATEPVLGAPSPAPHTPVRWTSPYGSSPNPRVGLIGRTVDAPRTYAVVSPQRVTRHARQ
jgi:hypothetical protein